MSPSITLTLPRLHKSQLSIKNDLARFNVIRCGRRFGKDVLGMDLLIQPALAGFPVAWFAPTYKMLAENWRNVRNLLHPLIKRALEQEKHIDLITGGSIDMWSLDHQDTARGRKYRRIVINEASMIRSLQESWEMIIRSTLADYEGDAFFTSTPRGLNYFYTLSQQAQDREDWRHFHFTTFDNPFIKRSEIASLKALLPERTYQQEIMAEFVEDGSFFQGVDQCAIIESPDTPDQHAGHAFVMGIDFANQEDYTVACVVCRECKRVVDWLRTNRVDYVYQRTLINELNQKWHCDAILPERNSIGEPNIELLFTDGLPIMSGQDGKLGFYTTATSKPALIQGLAVAMQFHDFKVPIAARDELLAFEVQTRENGYPKYSAPEGLHDDWVIALALTWQAATMLQPLLYF